MLKSNTVRSLSRGGLGITVAGTLALNMLIVPWEDTKLKPYLDIGGVPTACSGVTGPEITKAYEQDITFTQEQCITLDVQAVAKHEKGLRAAIDDDIEHQIPNLSMAAFISWTYNVGVGASSRSTLVRLLNEGDVKAACEQLSRWTRVKGQVIRGLENRRFRGDSQRVSERSMCLKGVDPSYESPLFEKLFVNYINWLDNVFNA